MPARIEARRLTLIIPRADRAGPCNLAVDVGRAALRRGYRVGVLYLSGGIQRDDLEGFHEVRRWRWSDLFLLRGAIHTHGLRPDLLGWLLSWGRGRTLVTTLHNYFLVDLLMIQRRWKVLLAWCLWSRAIARFHHRVCISTSMRRYYARLLPEVRFDVAYNFSSASAGEQGEPLDEVRRWIRGRRDSGDRCLAYVGAFIPRKNVLGLLDAVARTANVSIVLCGAGPLGDAVAKRVAMADLAGRALLAGFVRTPDQIVSECDMLVLPSRAEGLPLVVLEAARVGRPSLLSNIAVNRELSRMGLGCCFERHRFSDFATRIEEVIARFGSGETGNAAVVGIWKAHFAPDAGFERYEPLLSGARRSASR